MFSLLKPIFLMRCIEHKQILIFMNTLVAKYSMKITAGSKSSHTSNNFVNSYIMFVKSSITIKTFMKNYFLYTLFISLVYCNANSQGCATIRNIIGVGQFQPNTNSFSTSPWQLNISNRYYKSFRDFRRTVDLETPVQNEAINRNYSIDFAVTHLLPYGWSLSLSIPILDNSREASVEHGGPNTTRHTTRAFGLGDIRIMAAKWVLKPKENLKGNFQLGLGLKLPTGDFKVQDYFYRNDTTSVLAPVNPGIQLGDGGTGIITQLNGYYQVTKSLNLYADLYYMANPQEQNGVSVLSGRTPTSIQLKAGIPETSVTDAYVLRAGAYLNLKQKVTASLGIRKEGVPVEDFIGKSNGTRRPGYYLSIEPGLIYNSQKVSWYVQVPINIRQAIFQNIPDKIVEKLTGTPTSSPGGSSNNQFLFGALLRL